jgi:2-succinyl-5-enolpyruvyl-6-hydroxy-3-cyclohexene-1-carboxylate synthase
MSALNRNLLWTETFVDELARCGVQHVVIAPGSRSTPLVIAFAQHGGFIIHSLIDERSAAFFALGIGLRTGVPAALVCSSGTATANFYPAVIEARYSNVPLLVLTADRPHELRDSGANQTVNQINLYGDHALWFVDVALPEANPSGVMLRSLRTLACRAVATATGIESGPIHLNFPFRKPLEPIPVDTDNTAGIYPRPSGAPFTRLLRGDISPSLSQLSKLTALISQSRRPLMIAGPRASDMRDNSLVAVIKQFCAQTHIPLFADPLSNLRYADSGALSAYDLFFTPEVYATPPDLVILLGGMPASKALEDFFVKTDLENVVLFTADGRWTDPYHRLTHLIHADVGALLTMICDAGIRAASRDWFDHLAMLDSLTHQALTENLPSYWFDGAVVATATAYLPDGGQLFIGNSLPVRHLEQFALSSDKTMRVFCNRGASGIDGTVSTAFGIAVNQDAPTVFITGDLAFYHDMNGLLAAKRTGAKLVIVVVNNDGGGVFRRLPIVDFEPTFTDLFLTPHGLDFSHTAQMYGLSYQLVDNESSLVAGLHAAIAGDGSAIIEIRTDGVRDAEQRKSLLQAVQSRLKSLMVVPE